MKKAKHTEVLSWLIDNDPQAAGVCPDFVSAQAGKKNGTITMGVPPSVVHNLDGHTLQLWVINDEGYRKAMNTLNEALNAPTTPGEDWTEPINSRPDISRADPASILEFVRCLVIRHGEMRLLYYDFDYKCWNGEDNDDYECDFDEVEFWKYAPEWPTKK